MVRRDRRTLITALTGLMMVGAGTAAAHGDHAPDTSSAASVLSTLIGPENEGPLSVRWVFRQGDLLSCRTSVRDLRHILMAYGDRVRVTAVAIETDPEFVRSFLRGERLDAELVIVSEREYREELGSVPTPSVELLRAGTVIELFTAGNLILPGRRGTADLDTAVESLLPSQTAALSEAVSSLPHP
jgi:hypothetical protein